MERLVTLGLVMRKCNRTPDVRRFWELFAQNQHEAAQVLGRQMAASVPDVTEAGFDYNEGSGGEKKNGLPLNHLHSRQLVCGITSLRRVLL